MTAEREGLTGTRTVTIMPSGNQRGDMRGKWRGQLFHMLFVNTRQLESSLK